VHPRDLVPELTRSPEAELERLRSRLARERAARGEAEHLAEAATRRLYQKREELELLQAVTAAANQAESVEGAMRTAVRCICAHTGWPVGHVYTLADDASELVSTTIWEPADPGFFEAFKEATAATPFPPGRGLPGRVLATGVPEWIVDVAHDDNFPRASAAALVGLKAAFAFPVLVRGRVAAVLEFFGPEATDPNPAQLELMAMVGTQLGRVVERKSAEKYFEQALQDVLTGLPNRRRLMADFEQKAAEATMERPLLLVLFDLDGFKAYNDTFGHPAGDALLIRLGRNLTAEIAGLGWPYRMGGDEFCVLALLDSGGPAPVTRAAGAALSEHGEGFSVTASYGSVLVPVEAADLSQALQVADRRMYASKSIGSRASAGRQSADVLLKVLSERSPDLGTHLDEVTALCGAVGERLSLPEEDLAALLQAASLHDVGKASIPDEILNKPGPLDEEEWRFMRGHSVIGERILSAAPALTQAAKLVRASHERFDGAGYPDNLAGEDIPLGARIIAVCDAFDAMIANRPYRAARTVEEALDELRRCSGTQFDPAVVDAFCEVLVERQPTR
jgi:diguanylate cyclase (GGDEF)-like protein